MNSGTGKLTRQDPTPVLDLLADVMHLCDELGFDFDNELRSARDHHNAERSKPWGLG
jgi:hypothetical protein